MKKVTIIGAGFSGLTLAYKLAKKGVAVQVLEKSGRVGGLLGTEQTEFGIAEKAANALIKTNPSVQLFNELGLEPSFQLSTSKKRFLFRDKPRQWPLSFVETLLFIAKLFPKLLKGKSSLKPVANETLQEWGMRHLGEAPTRFILEPAMQGIYGNEISGLSASLILGSLFQKRKKDPYKGLLTGPGGMQNLVDHLEQKCRSLGVQFFLNTDVNLDQLTEPVVIATSAESAAKILLKKKPELAQLLSQIKMTSIISTTLFFKTPPSAKYHGFGCLIARGLGLRSLGVLMNSFIFKDRDKAHSETWMLGGVKNADLLDLSDALLLALILDERKKILGESQDVLNYRINRWPNALPYYDLNLEKTVHQLSPLLHQGPIYLHGNYLSGIGLSKILERSEQLAERIVSQHE